MVCTKYKRCGFTLIELLVVIAIISLLVSILLPSLQRAKNLAESVVCMSNLRQIGIAWITYTHEWEDFIGDYEQGTVWYWGGKRGLFGGPVAEERLLFPYVSESTQIFRCPADEGRAGGNGSGNPNFDMMGNSYGMANSSSRGVMALSKENTTWPGCSNPGKISLIEQPDTTIMVFDATVWNRTCKDLGYTVADYWHLDDRSNILMIDSHVEQVSRADLDDDVPMGNPGNPIGYSWGWLAWAPHDQW